MSLDKGKDEKWNPPSRISCTDKDRKGNSKIEILVRPATDRKGCKLNLKHRVPTGKDCTKMFEEVIDTCNKESGGFYLKKDDNGCWEYWIVGQPA